MMTSINPSRLLKMPLMELIREADLIRKKYLRSDVELCSIVNAKSGLCPEDCKFCAQAARHKTGVGIYPLKSVRQIITTARKAKDNGAKRFGIVTSGNRLQREELDVISNALSRIKNEIKIKTCASLGALDKSQLEKLKDAGLSRYHHNIETSPKFYPRVVSTHSFEDRLATIKNAKKTGLEVCSGGIIGMGESRRDRIDMACILADLAVDSVPINILVPIKNTPLGGIKPLSCGEIMRTIGIFRIILRDKTIKVAAGRESALQDFQAMAFMAGANGMLIGGYLTVKGRSVREDRALVKEIQRIWKE